MNHYELLMLELTDFGDAPLEKQWPNPVSEMELDDVEERLGDSLPLDYREFLRQYGGFNVYKYFLVPQSERSISLHVGISGFFNAKSLLSATSCVNVEEDLLPHNSIAIGFGDKGYILLVLYGQQKGQIYFWNFSQTGSAIESENLHFVANTFDEFMELLRIQN
ncbi:hypothetical protein IAD21_03931 [Abditibacteriota bacterium]|nr:hypothetical protein IAD21_03931 [Abditibacteriota bacterium]